MINGKFNTISQLKNTLDLLRKKMLSAMIKNNQPFFNFYSIFFIDLWLGQYKQNGDGLLRTAGNRSAELQQAASLLPMTNSSTQGYSSPYIPWDLDDHIR